MCYRGLTISSQRIEAFSLFYLICVLSATLESLRGEKSEGKSQKGKVRRERRMVGEREVGIGYFGCLLVYLNGISSGYAIEMEKTVPTTRKDRKT
jgi:hypothetical protein